MRRSTCNQVRGKPTWKAALSGYCSAFSRGISLTINSPALQGPNLMAGNVVMVKNLLISHDQVDRVIDDGRIMGVALTGSVEAGKLVAARAGRNLKKSTMELGASDAFIVLEDADLDKTVQWAVWAKMNNTGQCCVAAKRFIVAEELADRFLEKFQKALEALQAGDPMEKATTLGPLSTEAALVQLLGQVTGAVSHGATLVMGGKRIDRPGSFMQPTILTDIKPSNPAFREEFFGPAALLFRVKGEDEAVALANDSDFGLGGSVFTKDIARGKRVASRIDTGMVFIHQGSRVTLKSRSRHVNVIECSVGVSLVRIP